MLYTKPSLNGIPTRTIEKTLPDHISLEDSVICDADWDHTLPADIIARNGIVGQGSAHVFGTTGGGMSQIFCFRVDGKSYVMKYNPIAKSVKTHFHREVTNQYAASTISNTPEIYSARMGEETSAIIMRYVNGPMLEDITAGSNDVILETLRDLAIEMHKMHALNIIHRDIKPTNVIVTGTGPAIIDFGISVREHGTLTEPGGKICGTSSYIAPESYLSGEYSTLSDQYGFGVVACEMLIGEKPFEGTTDVSKLRSLHNNMSWRVNKEFLESQGYDRGIGHVIDRCLRKERENRFTNMRDVAKAITRYL